MYKQEEIKPYGEQGDKGELVEKMFDNIAPTYDVLNHRLSWDIDKRWRRKAIGQLVQRCSTLPRELAISLSWLPRCSIPAT